MLKKITKISVFDFDSTLVLSPLPDKGRVIYKEKTGENWPHKGWWGREESLDDIVFDIPTNAEVIADYEIERANSDTAVIMLTGRLQKLSKRVKEILDSRGLVFDGYYYNTGGTTLDSKISTLNHLLEKYPDAIDVRLWDDRVSQVSTFEQWGKDQCISGRLKDFKITVVASEEGGMH